MTLGRTCALCIVSLIRDVLSGPKQDTPPLALLSPWPVPSLEKLFGVAGRPSELPTSVEKKSE